MTEERSALRRHLETGLNRYAIITGAVELLFEVFRQPELQRAIGRVLGGAEQMREFARWAAVDGRPQIWWSAPIPDTRRLLLADFVPGSLIDVLEQAQVDFVDAAGNMLLRWPGKLYVHVKGMKPARVPEATASFLTTPNGLRVLFALLAEPGADVPAYRELSERAAVSLGTVGRVALELQRRGFLVMQRRRKRRVLHRKRELLELWVGGYAERLRPQLVIGRFRSPDRDLEDALKRLTAEGDGAFRWALTGGFAADALTGHYRGDQLIVFVDPWSSARAAALRWLPSVDGPITLLRMFWPGSVERVLEKGGARVAHPLLVYAELLFQGREREVETAKLVYDQYLQPNISGA